MPATLSDSALLARLVGLDTTSWRSNRPLAELVCDYLDRPGVEVVPNPAPDGEKRNLAVFLGPPVDPATRKGLVLSGHMDVVPAEEPEWESDPFELLDAGDRLVGRGTADMKGFLALAVNRAARLDPAKLRHPLVLLLTYDEEVGTLGSRHLLETWPRERILPRNAIIGEPTSLRVVRMHKGHLKMTITLRGVAAHSGYPHLGVNAIEPAGRVIQALAALRRELEREQPPNAAFFPEVPYAALNVARVEGGVATNVVPERCTVTVGGRVLPGMRSRDLAERVRAAVEAVTEGARCEIALDHDSPPLLLSEEAPICRHLAGMVHQEETASVSFATDAGWLQQLDLDCAIFGPGTIEVAHKPNEAIPKDQLARGGELLDRVIADHCF